jgi:hypothetical protein
MVKTFSAIGVAALLAAVVMVLPAMSPKVEASATGPAVKSDRLDYRPIGADCSQRSWPYYEAHCVRDRTGAPARALPVRMVTADRLPD